MFLPLLAADHHALFTLRTKAVSATLSIGAIVTGFVLTLRSSWRLGSARILRQLALHRQPERGLRPEARPLSLMMLLIVTGVGGAIHIYSAGYMHDDPAGRATSRA